MDVRTLVVGTLLLLVALTASVVLIGTGDFPIPAADVVRTLLGEGDPGQEFIVTELRLPRVLVGLLVGASLGLAGALFQSISRNPLGSPDVLGLGQGATAGALVVIVLFSGTANQVALGALVGGLATGFAIYVLAWKRGCTDIGWSWSVSVSRRSSPRSTAICSPSPTSWTRPVRSSG